jgi:hypothetical protein
MATFTKRSVWGWVRWLLLLGWVVPVGIILWIAFRPPPGESAEAICARIQEGMSAQDLDPILADCTFESAYGGEGMHCYYRCPDGKLLEITFDLSCEDHTCWPSKVISRHVSDLSRAPFADMVTDEQRRSWTWRRNAASPKMLPP